MKLVFFVLFLGCISQAASLGQKVESTATSGKNVASKYFRTLSAEFDSFFSSRRTSYLTNNSQFRIFDIATVREIEGFKNEVHVTANIVLPQTSKKLSLVVQRKPRRLEAPESPGQTTPAESPADSQKQSQTAAGVRYLLLFTEDWSISTDAGIQFESPAQPFGRMRISKSFFPITDVWELRIAEEAYYFFIDKWRLVTSFDSDHTLSENFLFRIGNELTWNQVSNGYEYLYGPSLFHKLTATQALSYHVKYLAKSQPMWQNVNLSVSVIYRQQIFRDWFFYELIPAVDFPRSRDWIITPSFSAKVEAVF